MQKKKNEWDHFVVLIMDFNPIPGTQNDSKDKSLQSGYYQCTMSCKLEDKLFTELFNNASLPDRARLLSVSSHHSSAWLSVTPSLRLNLHLDP